MKRFFLMVLVCVVMISCTLALTACSAGDGRDDTVEIEQPKTLGVGPIVEDKTFEELNTALEGFNLDRDATTYDDVAEFLGVHGKINEDHSESTKSASWYASDEGYVTIFFDKASGLYTSWSTSGIGRP